MKLHKGAGDLLAARAYKNRAPTTVTFQVTDRCNYQCTHCYQEHKAANELTTGEIENILDQLAAEGVLFLTLMGGEFFMRPDANEILRMSHERGFAIKLLSTGHHIHEKRADFLATMRPLQVDLSLYGAKPEVHEAITRQSGSWERTYGAARRLLKRKIPVLLKAPVMRSNRNDLLNLAEMAKEIGAQYSFDPKITAMENGDLSTVALRMTQSELDEFYQGSMAEFLATTYAGYDPQEEKRPLDHTPCRAAQQVCSIHPHGDVWPCNALPYPVGNLREQTFAEIWYGSEKLEEIRDLRWASISECNRCQLRNYCQRCHGMALVEQGKMKGPSLEACRHAVAVRDSLIAQGIVADSENELPPTWSRIDPDGQHQKRKGAKKNSQSEEQSSIRRSRSLRILP